MEQSSSPSTGSSPRPADLVGEDVEPVSSPAERLAICNHTQTLMADISSRLASPEFARRLFQSRDVANELVGALLHLREVTTRVMPPKPDLRIVR